MKLILTKLTDDQLDGLEEAARDIRLRNKERRLETTVELPKEAFNFFNFPDFIPASNNHKATN